MSHIFSLFLTSACFLAFYRYILTESVNNRDCNQERKEQRMDRQEIASKKLAAGLLGIFLGSLGIHKFLLGYQMQGVIMLLVSLFTCGIGATIMGIIGLIEGIIYLTMSDEMFYDTYIVNKKGWF